MVTVLKRIKQNQARKRAAKNGPLETNICLCHVMEGVQLSVNNHRAKASKVRYCRYGVDSFRTEQKVM